jgi:hypothetical protein
MASDLMKCTSIETAVAFIIWRSVVHIFPSTSRNGVLSNCDTLHFYFGRGNKGDSAVRVATGYGLEGRGAGVPVGALFSPLHAVQTGSGAHPSYYHMGYGSSLHGVNRLGREADNSSPTGQGQEHVRLCMLHIQCPINL